MAEKEKTKKDKILKAEVEKYRRWADRKGYFREFYSLIAYYNRKKKVKKINGVYFIYLGKKKYRLEEVKGAFTGRD